MGGDLGPPVRPGTGPASAGAAGALTRPSKTSPTNRPSSGSWARPPGPCWVRSPPDSLANEDFPFAAARTVTAAGIEVLALRMSYVGELGWELYVPNHQSVALFDALMAAGEPHGLTLAGYHAMNSLRLEAGYRHWGHDITGEDTPIEAGLGFVIGWDKAGRLHGPGRAGGPAASTPDQAADPVPPRRPRSDALPRRAIRRDGEIVGRVSSAHVELHRGPLPGHGLPGPSRGGDPGLAGPAAASRSRWPSAPSRPLRLFARSTIPAASGCACKGGP